MTQDINLDFAWQGFAGAVIDYEREMEDWERALKLARMTDDPTYTNETVRIAADGLSRTERRLARNAAKWFNLEHQRLLAEQGDDEDGGGEDD